MGKQIGCKVMACLGLLGIVWEEIALRFKAATNPRGDAAV